MTSSATTTDYRFWHPMAHPNDWAGREPLRIVKGDGLYIWDDKGRKMLDGFAGFGRRQSQQTLTGSG